MNNIELLEKRDGLHWPQDAGAVLPLEFEISERSIAAHIPHLIVVVTAAERSEIISLYESERDEARLVAAIRDTLMTEEHHLLFEDIGIDVRDALYGRSFGGRAANLVEMVLEDWNYTLNCHLFRVEW